MNVATSPLVTAYLADLDRALAGADPADRLEIVDAVREHIDAELGASPSQAEIAAVLRRLGTADDVASAWAVGADRPVRPAPPWSAPAGPLLRPSAHGLVPIPPDEATAQRTTSPWPVALVVVLGLIFGVPLILGLLGARPSCYPSGPAAPSSGARRTGSSRPDGGCSRLSSSPARSVSRSAGGGRHVTGADGLPASSSGWCSRS